MVRPSPRRKDHDVNALRIPRSCKAGAELLRCRRNTAQAIGIDSIVECAGIGAPFHLDKGERPPTPGNDVHLSARNTATTPDDPPAL